MVVKVVDFGFGVGVVDFVEEFVGEDSLDRMEDIGSIESIYHRDFSFLVPKVEVGTKVVAKNSNYLVGFESTFDYYSVEFVAPSMVF